MVVEGTYKRSVNITDQVLVHKTTRTHITYMFERMYV